MIGRVWVLVFVLVQGALWAEAKLCLTMIVKNESAIIERCLDGVKDVVDCVCICDTGSSDDTVQMVERYLSEHHIPGKVYRHEWKDFGHNRSLSAKAAQDMLRELGFPLADTYLLLIDADMVLVGADSFQKDRLVKDSYSLSQKMGDKRYYNTRLIKASLPWRCVGVTHEYWACPGSGQSDKLKSLWIDDRGDGGAKADKFERDLRLLTKGLEDEPDNVRYMYYLAQTYYCLKRYDEAIKWYTERINRQGWKDEVWHAKLMVADIYNAMGDWDRALKSYLEAYQYEPARAEPLERMALHYRRNNENHLAYLFAAQGAKIPYPTEAILFVEEGVYNHRFDEELSIAAYYTPFKEEGYVALERLLGNKKAPSLSKYQAERNLRFYTQPLKNVSFKSLSMKPPPIREGSNLSYNSTNPSIVKTDTGYLAIVRCVNYTQEGAQNYRMIDPERDGTILIKTRNFLVEYDKDFSLVSQKEIMDNLSQSFKQAPYRPIEGLEDCRLFKFKDALWATCTAADMNPSHVPQIALYKLNGGMLDHFIPLKGPQPGRCEKNWLPFVKEGQLHVIYSYDPLVVYKVDPSTGACDEALRREQKRDFSNLRGSAGPVPFDDGYLVVVHQVCYDQGRYYFHRFLYLDKDFNITKLSRPFTYQNNRVEYCCGMTIDHSGSNLVMTVGIEDKKALLALVDLDYVRSLLTETAPSQ